MRRKLVAITAAVLLFAFSCLLIAFPKEAFEASLMGLGVWWDVLFPSLFPFLVISEIMLGLGLVHFFGTILDPLMRPLFRLPGIGGFVMAMGFASGYPVGARLTAKLWNDKLVTREEGERLVAFTTSSDPIFLIGAVSVGFFHSPALASVLVIAHYGGAVLVGMLMRFHGKALSKETTNANQPKTVMNLLPSALEHMHQARMKDGRPLGQMLQEAVVNALQLVFIIGGLVLFFSTFMAVISAVGLMAYIHAAIAFIMSSVGLPAQLSEAVANGLFEVTLGAKAAASATGVPLMFKAAIAAFCLSWAGLSVHAQSFSLLHETNLRYTPFLLGRLLHGIISCLLTLLLWAPMQKFGALSAVQTIASSAMHGAKHFHLSIAAIALQFSLFLLLMLLGSVVICAVQTYRGRQQR